MSPLFQNPAKALFARLVACESTGKIHKKISTKQKASKSILWHDLKKLCQIRPQKPHPPPLYQWHKWHKKIEIWHTPSLQKPKAGAQSLASMRISRTNTKSHLKNDLKKGLKKLKHSKE